LHQSHAKISTTIEIYTQAGMGRKRIAQQKAVDVLFNRNQKTELTRPGK